MPSYKKVLVMILSYMLGFFIGYANAETTLKNFFRKKVNTPSDANSTDKKDGS